MTSPAPRPDALEIDLLTADGKTLRDWRTDLYAKMVDDAALGPDYDSKQFYSTYEKFRDAIVQQARVRLVSSPEGAGEREQNDEMAYEIAKGWAAYPAHGAGFRHEGILARAYLNIRESLSPATPPAARGDEERDKAPKPYAWEVRTDHWRRLFYEKVEAVKVWEALTPDDGTSFICPLFSDPRALAAPGEDADRGEDTDRLGSCHLCGGRVGFNRQPGFQRPDDTFEHFHRSDCDAARASRSGSADR